MSTTPWVRWFWNDYNADTAHLDLMQLGAYQRLLGFIYQRGQPLPGDIDKICRLSHATSAMEQTAIRQVLEEYFIPCNDPERGMVWRHLRAEREIEDAQNYQEMAQARARKAAEARWRKDARSIPSSNAPSIPEALLKQCHPQPQPQEDISLPKRRQSRSTREPRKPFAPPTLEEVQAYAQEIHSPVDPGYFLRKNTEDGWRDKKGNHYQSWKGVFLTWDKNQRENTEANSKQIPRARPNLADITD